MVSEELSPCGEREMMSLLVIHLEEGFDGDAVHLRVEGQTVLDREDVSTDYSVGLAAVVETEVAKGPVAVELEVPTRDLVDRTTWEAKGILYLGVRITEDEVHYRASDKPFLYF